jgi:hypothetical protein
MTGGWEREVICPEELHSKKQFSYYNSKAQALDFNNKKMDLMLLFCFICTYENIPAYLTNVSNNCPKVNDLALLLIV